MARRYQAPKHTSAVYTSTGEKKADKNGVITLPDDAPHSDDLQLRAVGCELINAAPSAKAPAAKRKSSPKKKAAAPKSDAPAE